MKSKNIKNYAQALEYLGGKKERPYAHNTRIEIDTLNLGHEVVTVKYHGNPVVNMFPDGTNTYSSCGWKTSTTKERINWFLPDGFSLYQEKSVWHIANRNKGEGYVFADGIAIDSNGSVYNAAPDNENEAIKKTIKAIKKFVDGYIKALLSGEVEQPGAGDCFYCQMVTTDGRNLGEVSGSDHLISHMEESYYVPSMLVNADKFKGMSILARSTIAQIWQGETTSDWQRDIMARDVKSSLTAYMKHCLNIAA